MLQSMHSLIHTFKYKLSIGRLGKQPRSASGASVEVTQLTAIISTTSPPQFHAPFAGSYGGAWGMMLLVKLQTLPHTFRATKQVTACLLTHFQEQEEERRGRGRLRRCLGVRLPGVTPTWTILPSLPLLHTNTDNT